MRLHLGCGHNYMNGWINVETRTDVKADIYSRIEDLEYPDNSIDEILMVAVFEHFPRNVAIMQLRKMYKWLINKGVLKIIVPDFWGTIDKLKESKTLQEQQFWYRHIFGSQDAVPYGIHCDGFNVEKLHWMFSIVGFDEGYYEMIKQWPSINYMGVKTKETKSDADAERDIINYMANYEALIESGEMFGSWMKSMGLKADKPKTPVFETQRRGE